MINANPTPAIAKLEGSGTAAPGAWIRPSRTLMLDEPYPVRSYAVMLDCTLVWRYKPAPRRG